MPVQRFASFDGAEIAWREVGDPGARALVLLHGLFSNGTVNWIRPGHAAAIAAKGFRVILPDLRGHGDSAAPHDPAAYPPDVLARDGLALVEHLELGDYDLGGYSLGGRTTARMLALGARPGRAVIAGMGLEGLLHTAGRGAFFRTVLEGFGTHAKLSPAWMAEAFLKTTKGDPAALIHILDTFVDTPADALGAIATETLVVTGSEDQDNGSAEALAAMLPNARYVEVPGTHMSAVLKPELGLAIAAFLAA
jgi:pimeloyl-ACP methyl ester carboxylesterase